MTPLHSSARERVRWFAIVVGVSVGLLGCGGDASNGDPANVQLRSARPLQKGTVAHWPEAPSYLLVDLDANPATVELGAPRPSGMDAFWSVAGTTAGGSAFFYSDS